MATSFHILNTIGHFTVEFVQNQSLFLKGSKFGKFEEDIRYEINRIPPHMFNNVMKL